jgi:hypothetical protein
MISLYQPTDLEHAMRTFRARLREHDIASEEAAVLARGRTPGDGDAGDPLAAEEHSRRPPFLIREVPEEDAVAHRRASVAYVRAWLTVP